MTNYRVGSKVTWKWGKGEANGTIEEIHKSHIEKTIKNSKITRNGTEENPAYFIKESGKDTHVLKLKSELS